MVLGVKTNRVKTVHTMKNLVSDPDAVNIYLGESLFMLVNGSVSELTLCFQD